MSTKLIKIFLLSWILFYQQAFANQVFFLENRGDAVREYRATRIRMNALGLGISNTPIPNGVANRSRLRELRDTIRDNARSLSRSVWSPSARDIEKINQVRRDFAEFRSLASEEHVQRVLENAQSNLGSDSLMVEARPDTSEVLTSNQVPNYCENYPVMDRETLLSFYGGAQAGEEFNCYDLNGNGVGLDLSEIGAALMSIEERGYQDQKRELQNGLIVKAVTGILEESSAYAGIYPGTDDNLDSLKRCARNRAVRNMGTHELRDAINEHEENLPGTIERLNGAFGEGENARRNALMATQVRQALIIGNLYNISSRSRTQADGTRITIMGGNYTDTFSREVREQCREQMIREHGFFIPENQAERYQMIRRCHELFDQGRYESVGACNSAYLAFRGSAENMTAQRACYYQRSGRSEEAPFTVAADNIIPLMTASVDSNPLLFNRDDSRSLIPFVSSESNYVPSDFANQVKDLPGASEISNAVVAVLAENPENPREAIEQRLAEPDMLALMAGAISSAQESEELNNSLKNEITEYQNELGESARDVCRNDGEHLHQFPALVNDVIAEDLEGVTDPRERERLLARRQAAQCWMLEDDPPEDEGGLPGGFFALGVGAIALGMIPGIGWVASAALIAAGTGVAATDSYLRFDHARDQLNATTAAFLGGWADANLVLERAAARTDANTNLWLEGLTVGILDVAAPVVRAGVRTVRRTTPDDVVEAVNRQARGGSPTSIADDQLPRPNGSRDEVLANARLSETDRIALIRQDYPNLNDAQIDAIMRAHREVDCAVYTCTPAQLRRKLEIMAEAGVPEDVRSAVIRRGIAGRTETGGAIGANIPDVPLDGRFLRYEEAANNFSAVPNQYRARIEEIHEGLFENSAEPFRFTGPNGAIDNVYVDSNRYGHFLDHVHALNSPEEVSDLLSQINQLSPDQLRSRLNRWRVSNNEPPLDADTHSSVVLSELSKFLGDTAGLRPNNKKVTTLFTSDWPPARVLEEVRQNPSIVQTVENSARTDGQVQVKFTIDNVQYTAWICRRAPQCDGGQPVNRMESLFPTCGEGVVQLNSRARFARHVQDNHGSSDSFTPPGFNHVGAAVTFGETGSTKPWDGGLIREVRCPR